MGLLTQFHNQDHATLDERAMCIDAVLDPLKAICAQYGHQIPDSLDVREGLILTDSWFFHLSDLVSVTLRAMSKGIRTRHPDVADYMARAASRPNGFKGNVNVRARELRTLVSNILETVQG